MQVGESDQLNTTCFMPAAPGVAQATVRWRKRGRGLRLMMTIVVSSNDDNDYDDEA